MKAGRELDVLVFQKVMGGGRVWSGLEVAVEKGHPGYYYIPSGKPWKTHSIDAKQVPLYSENISAAWKVVEKVAEIGISTNIEHYGGKSEIIVTMPNCRGGKVLEAETAPLAICLAALKAVGVEV